MKEITNVYVPVKTPDHKKWALLLALLIHSGILGFIFYTTHAKSLDEPVMETTLVTPEQLSAIQGQIAANQNNHAQNTGDSLNPDGTPANAPSTSEFLAGGSHSNMPAPHPTPQTTLSPEAQAIADDLAQRQAEFEKQRDAVAAAMDKQAEAELQGVAESIDQQHAENNQIVKEFKITESHTDEEAEALKKETEQVAKKLQAQREALAAAKNAGNQSFGIKADPNASTGSGQTAGGNGTPRAGGSKGGSSAGYLNRIIAIIYTNWNPPASSRGKSLTAHFNISPSGSTSGVSISGSGDDAFKNSLIQAIQTANLPPPPADSYAEFQSNDFTFKAK